MPISLKGVRLSEKVTLYISKVDKFGLKVDGEVLKVDDFDKKVDWFVQNMYIYALKVDEIVRNNKNAEVDGSWNVR